MSIEKISRKRYETLKNDYLTKNYGMYSLYIELNKELPISKQLFFKLINQIRVEEGLSELYSSKKVKKNNKIMLMDKSPKHYS